MPSGENGWQIEVEGFLLDLSHENAADRPRAAPKVLFADAEMNRADWFTAGAAVLGGRGGRPGHRCRHRAGRGADDRGAMANLLDNGPRVDDDSRPHPLPDQLLTAVLDHEWVAIRGCGCARKGTSSSGSCW